MLLIQASYQTVFVAIKFKKEEVHSLFQTRDRLHEVHGQSQVHPRHRKTLEQRTIGHSQEHHLRNIMKRAAVIVVL